MIHRISLSTMRHYDTKTSSFVNILKNFPLITESVSTNFRLRQSRIRTDFSPVAHRTRPKPLAQRTLEGFRQIKVSSERHVEICEKYVR